MSGSAGLGICRHCGSSDTAVNDHRKSANGVMKTRFKCRSCGRTWTGGYVGHSLDEATKSHNTAGFEEQGNHATMTIPREGQPPTLDTLFKKFQIEKDEWKVLSYRINEWQQHSGEHGIIPLYQGKATLARKNPVVCEWPVVQPLKLKALPMQRAKEVKGKTKRAIVIADSQVGFFRSFDTYNVSTLHDLSAFACVTKAIMDEAPDELILLGDMLDLPDWSDHFVQSPEFSFTTQMSINWFGSWLRSIRPFCGKIIYIEGNHETRLLRSIMTNTVSAFKLKPANLPAAPPLLSIETMLGLRELDIDYLGPYPKGSYWLNSNLQMIHGNKIGAKSGQTAMKMIDQLRASLVQGHVHRQESAHITSHSQEKNVTYGAYSLGALARIDGMVPSKNDQVNWQQGFAIVDYTEDLFQVNLVNIFGGKYIWQRQLFEADCIGNDDLPDEYVQAILSGAAIGLDSARTMECAI